MATELIFSTKTIEDLTRETMEDLQKTNINDSPAGVARLILEKVNEKIGAFYSQLETYHVQSFLSHATGDFLDRIGDLLNCKRMDQEEDEDYRYRIHQQTLTLEKANETAIRLAVLTTPGVADVILKPYVYGSGSFAVYPIFDDPYEWSNEIIQEIERRINDVKAFGVKTIIVQPKLLPVELKGRILVKSTVSQKEKESLKGQAIQAVRSYIQTRKPGEKLQIEDIIQLIHSLHTNILDVELYSLTINDRARNITTQNCEWDERFVEAQKPYAIDFLVV